MFGWLTYGSGDEVEKLIIISDGRPKQWNDSKKPLRDAPQVSAACGRERVRTVEYPPACGRRYCPGVTRRPQIFRNAIVRGIPCKSL